MTRLSEKRDVQDALVNYLIGIGWEYLPPDEISDFRSLSDFGSLPPTPIKDRFAKSPDAGHAGHTRKHPRAHSSRPGCP